MKRPSKAPAKAPAKPSQRRPTNDDMPLVFDLVSGGASLREACRQLGLHQPSTHAFIDADEGLSDQYVRAKEARGEHYQEDALLMGKAAALGKRLPDGSKIDPAGLRVYLDAVKWAVGRMAPKSGPVQKVQHSYDDLSDSDLDERIAALLGERDEDDEPSTEH